MSRVRSGGRTIAQSADWSTRELAEITGTTIKTVRHYHAIGLLAEPERSRNGYKHYRTHHLVRMLEIRRLAALGMPLAQISALADISRCPADVLHVLKQDLAQQIEQLQRARSSLTVLLKAGA
ncbi:helix-turn-helix domain-containing protein [Kineosporia babensis]|uniref:MerR family transcriptional regulator n=1 Tax=Kineosporia babensis TaxID=499548 RepID=A0A9X1SVJ3_9ACTN|nr:MerR family transcriptional regulator [Kineosporia babensis]MCD5314052.1 MerR family transcriptional regulator [Kineosporia babensis]